jgi:protein-S-isoprenylcysteine O-methyltransferase Ste14
MEKVKYFIKSSLGVLFFILIIFMAAGRADFIQGWVFLALSFFGLVLNLITIRNNEQLMEERAKPGKDVKPWDKKILGLLALTTLIAYIIAGLDAGRFHWSPVFNGAFFILGVFLILSGQIIFTFAKKQNAFFSSVARIQTESGHVVCDAGIYQFIRHPGYLGIIICWIGFPLVFSSIYCTAPVA